MDFGAIALRFVVAGIEQRGVGICRYISRGGLSSMICRRGKFGLVLAMHPGGSSGKTFSSSNKAFSSSYNAFSGSNNVPVALLRLKFRSASLSEFSAGIILVITNIVTVLYGVVRRVLAAGLLKDA